MRGATEGTAQGMRKGPHGGMNCPQTQQITTVYTCRRLSESGIWVQLPGSLSSWSPEAAVEVPDRVSPKRWVGIVCFQAQRTSCRWESGARGALAVPLGAAVSCWLLLVMLFAGGHLQFRANVSNTGVCLMKVSRR